MLPDKLLDRRLARFLEYGELARFVSLELGWRLPDIVPNAFPLPQVRFKLIEHADKLGRRGELVAAVLAETGGLPTPDEERGYLARMIQLAEIEAAPYTPLRGLAQTAGQSEAADSAVRLHFRLKRLASPLSHSAAKRQERSQREPYEDVLAAFPMISPVMLLGDPGAGKSTSLWKIFLDSAGRKLPILIRLGNWTRDEPLAEFFLREAPEVAWAIDALHKAGRLVLLLDGLNEMPTAKRDTKAKEIGDFIASLPGRPAVMISCRREDHTGALDLGLDTLTLEPLSPRQILAAVRKWTSLELADRFFWQLTGNPELPGALERWLAVGVPKEEFWNPTALIRLAANPFMLMMLFQVWEEKHELPRNRSELFETFVLWLLSREHLLEDDRRTPTEEGGELMEGLLSLAWRMQNDRIAAGETAGVGFGVLTVVTREDAISLLGSAAKLRRAMGCSLLEGTAEIRFRHQLLQEYFTARALAVELQFRHIEARELFGLERWWERSGWEETAVLLAGLYPQDCSSVVRWLARAQPEVAARCILESGAAIVDEAALRAYLQKIWEPRMTGPRRDAEPEARAAIGRALGRLGLDSRKGVGVVNGVPDIDWVEIPGGGFFIARYPVTNAQYQAFLDADDGYQDDRWWADLTDPVREPKAPTWTEGNHPRETVSWYEAMAFCVWLSHRLGFEVMLPREEEWERAARGPEGREYPWGDSFIEGFANTGESGVSRTTPVGIYPYGASAEGVLDLIGNVWEWCLNEYRNPTRAQRQGIGPRVLRGGSWLDVRGYARAAFRYHDHPGRPLQQCRASGGEASPSLDTEPLITER
jgi:hypothetical protein